MKHFIVVSDTDIVFVLKCSGAVIVQHTYSPNNAGQVEIDVSSIILPLLAYNLQDLSSVYEQSDIIKTFDAVITDVRTDATAVTTLNSSFKVIRAGVDKLADSAENFLTQNFLTWQPNIKAVTYYSPEFLTYYAVAACNVKCKSYVGGVASDVSLASLLAGTAYTIPVQYAIIAGKTNTMPEYYDVWVENASGQRLTYIQRYYASDMMSEEEQWILFENSLGGVDTFRAYGDTQLTASHTHNVAEIEDDSEEYRVDTTRKYKKNTGFLDKKSRLWLLDFFPSLGKYIYTGSFLRRIVVTDSDVNYQSKELPSNYNFTFKFADARPYLNLPRTDTPQTVLDIKVPDVGSFTVAPRLVEFPRLTLSSGALFPVQNPYSEGWTTTTIAAIFDFVIEQITSNYSGNGGIGHTHPNVALLNALSFVDNYLQVNGSKIKAAFADVAAKLSDDSEVWKQMAKMFLSRQNDDSAEGLIDFKKGIEINWNFTDIINYIGGKIDNNGNAYFQSLVLSKFLSVPEIVFNRVAVIEGELWQTHGYGTFEKVKEDVDAAGNVLTTGTATLHLSNDDYGTIKVGDLCRGVYSDIGDAHGSSAIVEYETNEDGSPKTYDDTTTQELGSHIIYKTDGLGFPLRKGFYNSYFQVVSIIENNTTDSNGKRQFVFTYQLYDGVDRNFHPCENMKFAQYGSLNDKTRQNSIFINTTTQSFIQVLRHVSTFAISSYNIAARYGELEGLKIECKTEDGGTTMQTLHGDGLYVQGNIYFGSSIQQLNPVTYDDILDKLKIYTAKLTRDNDIAPIDSEGNIIGGIQDGGTYKFYTAVDVRRRDGTPLTYNGSDGDTSATVGTGEYGISIVSSNCKATVKDGNVYVTGISNCHDGDATTVDNIDYTEMRKMAAATVDVFINPEGLGVTLQTTYHIAITHETTPYIAADLTNPMDSIVYDTAKRQYVGLPMTTKMRMWKGNEQLTLKQLVVNTTITGLTTATDLATGTVSISQTSSTMDDVLPGTIAISISATVDYAGDSYERILELKIVKKKGEQYYLDSAPKQVIAFSVSDKYEYDSSAISCAIFTTDSSGIKTSVALSELTARGLYIRQTIKYNDGTADKAGQYAAAIAPADNIASVKFELCAYDGTTVGDVIDYDDIPILRGGLNGKDGMSFKYIYKLDDSEPPQYGGKYDGVSTTFELGWVDDQPSVENVDGKRTCWMCYSYLKDNAWSEWSMPKRVAHYGESQYLHIVFASTLDANGYGVGLLTIPEKYIGYCVNTTPDTPEDTKAYKWTQFQGDPGKNGTGIPGTSYYVHIAWGNSADEGNTITDFATSKKSGVTYNYMGVCTDTTEADPETSSSYTWSKIKGDPGKDGNPGADGKDSITLYCLSATECTVSVDQNSKACEDGSAYFSFSMKKGNADDTISTLTVDGNVSTNPTYYIYEWKRGDTIRARSLSVTAMDNNGVSRSMYLYIKTFVVIPVYLAGKSIYDNTVSHHLNNYSQTPSDSQNTMIAYGKEAFAYDHVAWATAADGSTGFTTSGDGTGCTYVGKCTDGNPDDPTTASSYTWTAKGSETDGSSYGKYRKWRNTAMALSIESGVLLDVEVTAYVSPSRRLIVYDQQIEYASLSNTSTYAMLMTSHKVVKTTGSSTFIYGIVTTLDSYTNINDAQSYIKSIHIRKFETTSETPSFLNEGALKGIFNANLGNSKTSIHAYDWYLSSPDKGQMRRFTSLAAGQEYCNYDADQQTDSDGGKWVDFLGLKGGGYATGYAYYQCRTYHSAYGSYSTYDAIKGTAEEGKWMEVSQQAVGVFGFLIAKNAIIDFLQSQSIRVGENDNITGGMCAPDAYGNVIWAGSTASTSAPFHVTKSGKVYASDGEFKGNITATQGKIGGWSISGNDLVCTQETSQSPLAGMRIENASGTRFLRVNDSQNTLMSLRADGVTGLYIYTQSASGTCINLTAQTGSTAIESYGKNKFISRSGESTLISGLALAMVIIPTTASGSLGTIGLASSLRYNTYFMPNFILSLTDNDITLTLPDGDDAADARIMYIRKGGKGNITVRSGTGKQILNGYKSGGSADASSVVIDYAKCGMFVYVASKNYWVYNTQD